MISSFSLDAYMQMLSSDFLYPSNYTPRNEEDKGSLKESLPSDSFDIFERGEDLDHHILAKVGRAVLRSFVMLGLLAFVAPAGSIWHLYQSGSHLFMIVKDGASKEHRWDKVRLHLQAFLIDTCLALPMLYLTSTLFVPSLAHPDLIVFTALISWLFPIYSGCYPQGAVSLLAWSDETPGYLKSIILKNEFGLVGTHGYLLRSDQTEDSEQLNVFAGHFGEIYLMQGIAFLEAIQELQKQLVTSSQLVIHYPPSAAQMEGLMNNHSNVFKGVNTVTQIKKFKKLEDNIIQARQLLLTCLLAQYGVDRDAPIRIPSFPCPVDQCVSFCKVGDKTFNWDADWVKLVEKASTELKEIDDKRSEEERQKRDEVLPKDYSSYLKRVRDQLDVHKFFGFEVSKIKMVDLGEAWKKAVEVLNKAADVLKDDPEIQILQKVTERGFELFSGMIVS